MFSGMTILGDGAVGLAQSLAGAALSRSERLLSLTRADYRCWFILLCRDPAPLPHLLGAALAQLLPIDFKHQRKRAKVDDKAD